ncbi:hypothetical protein BHM03_00027876 [Ensete ventricosum]|nr:hypothetical protein BHM03_00027876 [Ensete ventricosum]
MIVVVLYVDPSGSARWSRKIPLQRRYGLLTIPSRALQRRTKYTWVDGWHRAPLNSDLTAAACGGSRSRRSGSYTRGAPPTRSFQWWFSNSNRVSLFRRRGGKGEACWFGSLESDTGRGDRFGGGRGGFDRFLLARAPFE